MRDVRRDGAGDGRGAVPGELERTPGKATLQDAHAGAPTAPATPGKQTLVEQHAVSGGAFESLVGDGQQHLRELDAALQANDAPKVEATASALNHALDLMRSTPVDGGANQRDLFRAGIELVAQAAPLLEQARDRRSPASIAARGTRGAGQQLPFLDRIQASFGRHDVSHVRAHTGGESAEAAGALGARAYAVGDRVAFAGSPDLHTAAHEAAHVVQQRAGVSLKGEVDGGASDPHEQHADAVADAVVAGRSAESLLDRMPAGGSHAAAVQRKTGGSSAGGAGEPGITPPTPGIDKAGFIDHSDGANIRSAPAETGGKTVHDGPLPPATRVFVSGTFPGATDWWYVTAFLKDTIVRGYVQNFRVATDLPEPLAKLHQVVHGDTAEKVAVQEYKTAVRDGHDLRYYENVLLYVNRQAGRAGIRGSYQDPGLFGGGANNVQLEAGHRIWLVSPAYAKELENIVPDGSFSNGLYAKAKRFVQHVRDIVASVTESKDHFGDVAGEYAQAIRDHMAEIVGITAGFIMAEATSMFLAATPTGVGQAAAAIIQLALSAFGAAGAVMAGAEALKHGSAWLTTAWTAKGDKTKITAASIEFIKMLVSIAMAALSAMGAKGNYANALKIGNTMNMAPAMALADGGAMAGAGTATAVGPTLGPVGAAGAMMTTHDGEGGKPRSADDRAPEPKQETAKPQEPKSEEPKPESRVEPKEEPLPGHGPSADDPGRPTRPSHKPDESRTPGGRRTRIDPHDRDPANIRAIEKENQSADRFAKDGYEVDQNPTVKGDKRPDYQIEGRIFDNYAPTTGNPRSIWTTVQGKVASGQTTRVVLNVTETKIDIAALRTQFQKWPIDGLEEVLAVTDTSIERIWP